MKNRILTTKTRSLTALLCPSPFSFLDNRVISFPEIHLPDEMHVGTGLWGVGRNAWGPPHHQNEKQVTVHCENICLVGSEEEKKREEGKDWWERKPLRFSASEWSYFQWLCVCPQSHRHMACMADDLGIFTMQRGSYLERKTKKSNKKDEHTLPAFP